MRCGGVVRVLVIHLNNRVPKLDERAKGELLAPDAATVERIVRELGVPYDRVVAVKQVLP
jgi:hypothetical protein